MGVKIKRTQKGNFTKRLKKIQPELNKDLNFGIFEKSILEYAPAHEFGARIKVTEKMRKFFIYKSIENPGIWHPLKPSTKYIIIPRRSFLQGFLDNNKKLIRKFAINLVNPVVTKGESLKMEKFIDEVITENLRHYDSISSPKKTKIAEFESGTDKLLRSQGNSLRGSLKGKVE